MDQKWGAAKIANGVKAPKGVLPRRDELAKGVVKLREMGKSSEEEVKPVGVARRLRGWARARCFSHRGKV